MELILDRHRPGAQNMALDVALLERARPTVRLYGWEPGCVSLGYTQAPNEVDQAAIARHGFDLVERPTGGGAIYHAPSEVTYCVVLPTDHPGLPNDLFASYKFMAEGVRRALDELGLDASYREAKGGKDSFCYLRAAGVAIVAEGRKVSGGAQRRTKLAVLQHGTVLVENDPALLAELFHEDEDRIRQGVGSLTDLGVHLPREELASRLADAFLEALGVEECHERGPEGCEGLLAAPTA